MENFSLVNLPKVLGKYLFVFCFIFQFCNIQATGLSESQDNKSLSEGLAVNRSFSEGLFQSLNKIVKDFQRWDYDKTTQITIFIPGINKEVVFNWGFAGSGDLFTPLGNVKAKWKNSSYGEGQDNFAVGLGKALIEDQLNQMGSEVPGLSWLLNANMSAKALFCVKLLMLFKSMGQEGSASKIQAEFLRLLVRLAQVDDFKIFESYKNFSEYLPPYVKEIIEKISPQSLIFMNEVFSIIADSNKGWDSEKSLLISGFVFSDEKTANEFKEKYGNNKNFIESVKQEIEKSGRGDLSAKEFFEFKDVPQIGQNLIGAQDFGIVQRQNLASLPDCVKKAISLITDSTQLPKVLKVSNSPDEIWLFHISDRLNSAQTMKMLLSTLIQAFREYKQARTGYFKANSEQKNKFEDLMNEQQQKIINVEKFLQTENGRKSQERLEKELEEINIHFASNSKDKSIVELFEAKKQQEKLEELNQKAKTLEKEIFAKRQLLGLGKHTDRLNQQIIDEKTEQLEALRKEVLVIEQTKGSSGTNVGQDLFAEQKKLINKYKENLQKLENIVRDKELAGETVDENLLRTIATLKSKIDEQEGKDDSSLTLQNRLEKRRMFANAYLRETDRLQKELDTKKAGLETIIDPVDREVEQWMLHETEKQFFLQMQNLKEEAEKIVEENKQVEVLHRLQEKINQGILLEQAQEELQKLQNTVGYIIDGKKCTSPVVNYLQTNKEFKEFTSCLNSNIPEYQQIKTNLKDRLMQVAQKSDHIQDHRNVYDYLLMKFIPELQVCVGGLEKELGN